MVEIKPNVCGVNKEVFLKKSSTIRNSKKKTEPELFKFSNN